jgi:hypothetical protein
MSPTHDGSAGAICHSPKVWYNGRVSLATAGGLLDPLACAEVSIASAQTVSANRLKKLGGVMNRMKNRMVILAVAITMIVGTLACSTTTLVGRRAEPTATPTKTPKPTFTVTLTPTETPIPTDTPLPTDTPTPVTPTNTPVVLTATFTRPTPLSRRPTRPNRLPSPSPGRRPPPPRNQRRSRRPSLSSRGLGRLTTV